MASRPRVPNAADWIRPWMQMTEIAVTAPWVIGMRTAAALTGGWPPDTRELTRMWTEKVEAFSQAAVAAATGRPGAATTGRILTPVRSRVRGNVRRLSRG